MIGIDVVAMARFSRGISRLPALAGRIFSPSELSLAGSLPARRRAEFLAGRFAAKEAILKALRISMGDGSILREIEILVEDDGAPKVVLAGTAAKRVRSAGQTCNVSISHDGGFACAVACVL